MVKYCADFEYPSSFGFTGSAGQTTVRPHMRGVNMAKGGKAKNNWIQGAVKNPGGLHRALGVPQGDKIPRGKINKAAESSNPKLRHMAQFAKNVPHKADGGKVDSADRDDQFAETHDMKKGGKVKEGSPADMRADKAGAKKHGMSIKDWEKSPMDAKQDAGMKKGGKAVSFKKILKKDGGGRVPEMDAKEYAEGGAITDQDAERWYKRDPNAPVSRGVTTDRDAPEYWYKRDPNAPVSRGVTTDRDEYLMKNGPGYRSGKMPEKAYAKGGKTKAFGGKQAPAFMRAPMFGKK